MHRKKLIIVLSMLAVALWSAYWLILRYHRNDPLLRYQVAMQADASGGATPDETLRLFIAALRADDAVRAAEYFMLDQTVSRAWWVAKLADLKARGLFSRMADDIERHAKLITPSRAGDAGYELLNDDGTVGTILDMEFNAFSKVWKLQSL